MRNDFFASLIEQTNDEYPSHGILAAAIFGITSFMYDVEFLQGPLDYKSLVLFQFTLVKICRSN